MTKISSQLQSEIDSQIDTHFNVLIILKHNYDARSLKIGGYTIISENIIQDRLDTQTIIRLASNENVVSIDKDSEMGIL